MQLYIYNTLYPGSLGCIIARLVLPQADGNAATIYFFSPCGLVIPTNRYVGTFSFGKFFVGPRHF